MTPPRPYRTNRYSIRARAAAGEKTWHPHGPIGTVTRHPDGNITIHAVTTTGDLVRIRLTTAQAIATGGAIIGAGRHTPKDHQ